MVCPSETKKGSWRLFLDGEISHLSKIKYIWRFAESLHTIQNSMTGVSMSNESKWKTPDIKSLSIHDLMCFNILKWTSSLQIPLQQQKMALHANFEMIKINCCQIKRNLFVEETKLVWKHSNSIQIYIYVNFLIRYTLEKLSKSVWITRISGLCMNTKT